MSKYKPRGVSSWPSKSSVLQAMNLDFVRASHAAFTVFRYVVGEIKREELERLLQPSLPGIENNDKS